MTAASTYALTPDVRNRILAAVYRELFITCPAKAGEVRTLEGASVIETHLEEIVGIVRRSTATTVEPYLAQILDEVCSRCPHQTVSGFCPLRADGPCVLFRFAEPIVRAVGRALLDMGDEEYLRQRTPG
jgi:hypothetical protein